MKKKTIILISMGIVYLCNSDITEAQRRGIGRHTMPSHRIPNRPPRPRPPMANRPTNNIRPHRPIARPPHIHYNPIYHTRYWYHHPTPYYWGSNWHPIGSFIGSIATISLATAIVADIASQQTQPIYYNDGVFYRKQNDGYIVIAPPIGYGVEVLPNNTFATTYNGETYYYYNGTFYRKDMNRYVVVSPPIGCIVLNLPSDAEEITNDGFIYYYSNGTYYQPVNENNIPAYQVIEYIGEK